MRRAIASLAGGVLAALAVALAAPAALAQTTYAPTSVVRLNGVTYEGTQGRRGPC